MCDCAEKVRDLVRTYDGRFTAAAESGEPAARTLARQIRDDLDQLADHCERTPPDA